MATRDIVVVGGSAGALEALKTVLPDLPGDLPAVIFVVVHIGATAPSVLPEILSRAGRLPAQTARDGALSSTAASTSRRPTCICCSTAAELFCAADHGRTFRGPRSIRCSARPRPSSARG